MQTEHSAAKVNGFDIVDVTHSDPQYQTGDLIGLYHGGEGRWLTAQEALAVAAALTTAANAQLARAGAPA